MRHNKILNQILSIEPYLSKVAFGLLNQESDVQDAISETTLTILNKFDQLKNTDYFKTWATRICINECYGILKMRKRFVELDESFLVDKKENYQNLYEALYTLSTQHRTIVVLKYLLGYTFKEIAEIVESSPTTVQRMNQDALKHLRVELEDE